MIEYTLRNEGLEAGCPAIETTALTKSYNHGQVLHGVDLCVAPGTVVSLLGPNGAGKTTMVRILSTLVTPDGGRAWVAGFDVVAERRQVRRLISVTGQFAALDGVQTGEENLRLMGRLSGLSWEAARLRAAELLDQFDLAESARRRVATYSGGMRRRLDLAASLVGQPSVVFLDEPTTGLDPRSRQDLWEIVAGLARSGVTVFLTTQYLEEADRLADRVAVIDTGRIVAEGTPRQLKAQVGDERLELTCTDHLAFDDVVRALGSRPATTNRPQLAVSVGIDGNAEQVRRLLDEIDPDRDKVASFAVQTPTLDDVFMMITGHRVPVPATGKETAHV